MYIKRMEEARIVKYNTYKQNAMHTQKQKQKTTTKHTHTHKNKNKNKKEKKTTTYTCFRFDSGCQCYVFLSNRYVF